MKQLCAIISGGQEDTLCGIEAADFIIACDRGYFYARNTGIRPYLLVGDFDSYRGALPADVPVLDLPVEKDDTDTMAAVRWAAGWTICWEISRVCLLPADMARRRRFMGARRGCI